MPDGFVRHFLRFQIDPVALGGFKRVFKFAARAENRLSGSNIVHFAGNQHACFLRRAVIYNVCYCTIKAFALQLFCRGIHAFEKLDFSEQALNLAEAKAT